VRFGETLSRPYKSQSEAVRAAFKHAMSMSKEGLEAEVVLKLMTCQFGPNGYFKAVPTPRDNPPD
jgi:hypothetical protein